MSTSVTQSGIMVDFSAYIWAWGKAPRGKGNWAFYLGDETEPRFYYGSFADTKKQAVRDAKAAGYWRVKVSS